MACIYGLFDPRRPLLLWEVRYIGQTTVKLNFRLNQHISQARGDGERYIDRWIRSLLRADVRPIIHVLETVEAERRFLREVAWIASGRQQRWRLTNATDGGEGTNGYKTSLETREKQRLAKVGKKQTEEAKRNAVEGMRLARLADPTIDQRRGQSVTRRYQEDPTILERIGEGVKQYWLDHPDELISLNERRQKILSDPEFLERRGLAIAEAKAKQDKSQRYCEVCDGGPFIGPAGLSNHMAKQHNDNFRQPHYCECGAGPFVGERGLNHHQANSTKCTRNTSQ